MGRDKRASGSGRDGQSFALIPWAVLDSPTYRTLSMHARALLLEMARQFVGNNNGSLLCSRKYMGERGWNSVDMLSKAKAELLAAGFLHETVKGQRPNKASWYAVTWLALDRLKGYDAGAAETFKRSAYKAATVATPKLTRDQLFEKWRAPLPETAQ
jgi:hypothetical protein